MMTFKTRLVVFASLFWAAVIVTTLPAANILFVGGGDPNPTSGTDGAIFDHLEALGHNVEYLSGDASRTEDAEAVDLLIISSTLGSGSVRGKFPDIETPILQWEEALMDIQPGNFQTGFGQSLNGNDAEIDSIVITNPNHFLAAGLPAGEVVIADFPISQPSIEDIAPGVIEIAEHVDFPERKVFTAVETGGELADGSFSAGPRVNFFIENDDFESLNDVGLMLFDNAIAWLLGDVGGAPQLQAGDANQDFNFNQLDLVQVQVAAKYLTGQAATWGEGDWDGAPGGQQGAPPMGDGQFNQLDIIAALNAGKYLTGPYAAVKPAGQGSGNATLVYDPATGELAVQVPGTELTSINIDSATSIFTGDAAMNLGGSFDNDADNNIFKATFGSSFGSLSFGNVAQTGLSEELVLNDLTVIGSLAGGGDLGDVDLIYVPEPSPALLAGLGGLALFALVSRFRTYRLNYSQ